MGSKVSAPRSLCGCALLGLMLAGCAGKVSTTTNPDPNSNPTSDPPSAATASLSAASEVVASGAATTLTWSSTNATSCTALEGWSGTLASSGSKSTAAITSDTTYSITCTGAGGTSSVASVTVNVVPTASISANPTAVANGGSSTLSWNSTNATSCTASGGWSAALPSSGSQSTSPINTATTYSITCSGAGGTSATASVTVNITGSPLPTASLSANPTTVASGGSSMLSWSSTNATSCTAAGGWSGKLATSGSQSSGAISNTTTYSLSCSGLGGTSTVSSATVTVAGGSMSISPTVAALTLSQSQQFTVTIPGGGGASWTVDGVSGGNSSVGLITPTGLYTPGTATGAHTVVATSTANNAMTASAQVYVTNLAGVFTYHNDIARQGANTQEYALTPSSVNTSNFGKLFSCTADGAIYAQPLWVAGLLVSGATRNVVFVATAHDGLFAFDADASPCATLWSVSLIDSSHGATAGETTVPSGGSGYLVGSGDGDITPETGVIGTPVIDPNTQTLYVVSKSVSSDHLTFYQRLHAINVLTGQERSGSPVTIAATYPGTGDGGAITTFNARTELQRPGLALVNGTVYISWASHEDTSPYYGWVVGYSYNGSAFSQSAVLNVTPNVRAGGIWMSGGAPASDGSNLYLLTGNGGFDANSASAPNNDYGDSLLQLSSTLSVGSYFTPSDQASDEANDSDFGSGGTAVLADLSTMHLILGGGKDGNLYVLNRDALGGYGDSFALQKISVGRGMFMTGAYWNYYYFMAGIGVLQAYQLTMPAVPNFTLNSSSSNSFGFPGATPSVSANGTQNGIVWALDSHMYCTDQSKGCGAAVLHAYNATNVTQEYWNSSMVGADAAGNAVKFTVPTVANGKVYVGTRGNNTGGAYGSTTVSGELDVYGLKSN